MKGRGRDKDWVYLPGGTRGAYQTRCEHSELTGNAGGDIKKQEPLRLSVDGTLRLRLTQIF